MGLRLGFACYPARSVAALSSFATTSWHLANFTWRIQQAAGNAIEAVGDPTSRTSLPPGCGLAV
jgi:hypothetical protein